MHLGRFRFASIGSGSKGNGLIVEGGKTRVLLDCGFGLKDSIKRMLFHGVEPSSLDAIIVTHEHGDHVSGVQKLSSKYKLPVFLTNGTLQAVAEKFTLSNTVIIEGYESFTIGELSINPFPVPHDAREPAQFVFSNGKKKLGVLTDLGRSTKHLESMLSGCDGLVLECNHDRYLLEKSNYPLSLKNRIGGSLGHLSNDAAANILLNIDTKKLKKIVAAHLSESNNTPQLAKTSLSQALSVSPDHIEIADQESGFDWIEL